MSARSDVPSEILASHDLQRSRLEAFRATCHQLIGWLLRANGLNAHSVTSGGKDRDSLAEKLARPGKQYASVWDVTDIVALRVIAYFDDEVDRIGALIEREFEVDAARPAAAGPEVLSSTGMGVRER